MGNKELKTVWKYSKHFWIGGFVLWLIETTIFLIIEGWHLKATNPIEIYLDGIVSDMWFIALASTVYVVVNSGINLIQKK
jgi:hypothetical protein